MASIIVADDDDGVRKSLCTFLRRLGHDVIEARDGMAALAAFREATPDLVITDINMPDMDGIELLEAIREANPEVPIIAISGGGLFPSELLLDNAAVLGSFATIEKPLDLEVVRSIVASALGDG